MIAPASPPIRRPAALPHLTAEQLDAIADAIATRLAGRLGSVEPPAGNEPSTSAGEPRPLLDRCDLAAELGVSVSSVDRWTKAGRIRAHRGRRRVLYDLGEVRADLTAKR